MGINVWTGVINTIQSRRVGKHHSLWRGVGRETGSEVIVIPISNFSWHRRVETVRQSGRSVDVVP